MWNDELIDEFEKYHCPTCQDTKVIPATRQQMLSCINLLKNKNKDVEGDWIFSVWKQTGTIPCPDCEGKDEF